jgi:hypothetical protein
VAPLAADAKANIMTQLRMARMNISFLQMLKERLAGRDQSAISRYEVHAAVNGKMSERIKAKCD